MSFVSHDLLNRRTSIGALWWVGNGRITDRQLKAVATQADVAGLCAALLSPAEPLALRTQAVLLRGLSLILSTQATQLLYDALRELHRFRAFFCKPCDLPQPTARFAAVTHAFTARATVAAAHSSFAGGGQQPLLAYAPPDGYESGLADGTDGAGNWDAYDFGAELLEAAELRDDYFELELCGGSEAQDDAAAHFAGIGYSGETDDEQSDQRGAVGGARRVALWPAGAGSAVLAPGDVAVDGGFDAVPHGEYAKHIGLYAGAAPADESGVAHAPLPPADAARPSGAGDAADSSGDEGDWGADNDGSALPLRTPPPREATEQAPASGGAAEAQVVAAAVDDDTRSHRSGPTTTAGSEDGALEETADYHSGETTGALVPLPVQRRPPPRRARQRGGGARGKSQAHRLLAFDRGAGGTQIARRVYETWLLSTTELVRPAAAAAAAADYGLPGRSRSRSAGETDVGAAGGSADALARRAAVWLAQPCVSARFDSEELRSAWQLLAGPPKLPERKQLTTPGADDDDGGAAAAGGWGQPSSPLSLHPTEYSSPEALRRAAAAACSRSRSTSAVDSGEPAGADAFGGTEFAAPDFGADFGGDEYARPGEEEASPAVAALSGTALRVLRAVRAVHSQLATELPVAACVVTFEAQLLPTLPPVAAGRTYRAHVAATLACTLLLASHGRISLAQSTPYGEISISPGPAWSAPETQRNRSATKVLEPLVSSDQPSGSPKELHSPSTYPSHSQE
ncbi:hypothetical protein T492DRAFT_843061 [Pavlovales sp. CCMP2436]|nr:hypothetical protein T492DRAFT_843061 [Pavlovales sp. CCMP2436]